MSSVEGPRKSGDQSLFQSVDKNIGAPDQEVVNKVKAGWENAQSVEGKVKSSKGFIPEVIVTHDGRTIRTGVQPKKEEKESDLQKTLRERVERNFTHLTPDEVKVRVKEQIQEINELKEQIDAEKAKSKKGFLKLYKAISNFFSKEQMKAIREKISNVKLFKGSKVAPVTEEQEAEEVVEVVLRTCGDLQEALNMAETDRKGAFRMLKEDKMALQETLEGVKSGNETIFKRFITLISSKFKREN